jgi:hypothetical protein
MVGMAQGSSEKETAQPVAIGVPRPRRQSRCQEEETWPPPEDEAPIPYRHGKARQGDRAGFMQISDVREALA